MFLERFNLSRAREIAGRLRLLIFVSSILNLLVMDRRKAAVGAAGEQFLRGFVPRHHGDLPVNQRTVDISVSVTSLDTVSNVRHVILTSPRRNNTIAAARSWVTHRPPYGQAHAEDDRHASSSPSLTSSLTATVPQELSLSLFSLSVV
jgi:hypothetical protein